MDKKGRCPVCGKEFERTASRLVYCCKECAVADQKAGFRIGRRNLGPAVCPVCGKSFERRPRRQEYCSLACSRKAFKGGGPGSAEPAAPGGEKRRLGLDLGMSFWDQLHLPPGEKYRYSRYWTATERQIALEYNIRHEDDGWLRERIAGALKGTVKE